MTSSILLIYSIRLSLSVRPEGTIVEKRAIVDAWNFAFSSSLPDGNIYYRFVFLIYYGFIVDDAKRRNVKYEMIGDCLFLLSLSHSLFVFVAYYRFADAH